MAAVDYFMKLDGIEGESTDDKHAKEIDVLSFSWGATQGASAAGAAGARAGKVSFHDLQITKKTDSSSPKLFQACASGQHIKEAQITVRKSGDRPVEYLTITLEDCLISSFASSGESGETPSDQFSVSYSSLKVSAQRILPTGALDTPVTAGWDLSLNRRV